MQQGEAQLGGAAKDYDGSEQERPRGARGRRGSKNKVNTNTIPPYHALFLNKIYFFLGSFPRLFQPRNRPVRAIPLRRRRR